jgi:2-polyprenyl-3-methyl-5-hydroxy-6-metoxy-1,4-benzoquinol methylase
MTEERIDLLTTKNLGNVLRHVERYAWAARLVRGRVIDVACGTGYGSALLAGSPKIKSVLGIDRDPATIHTCQARYHHAAPRLSFKIGDALEITGAQTVVSFETIEHLPTPEKFLHRVHHILDPKRGMLLCSVPIGERPGQNRFHFHTFTRKSFVALLTQCGFRIVDQLLQNDNPKSAALVVQATRIE